MNWEKLAYYLLIAQCINCVALLDIALWQLLLGGGS